MHIIYCETKNTGFTFEPFNALSNGVFLLFAYYAAKYIQDNKVRDKSIQKLPYFLGGIGIASFAFHSFRNWYTSYIDVFSVSLFILFILYIIVGKMTKNKKIVFVVVGFFGLIQLILYLRFLGLLYGSLNYIFILGALLLLGIAIYRKFGTKLIRPFILFITLFTIALTVRGLDPRVCPYFPMGSHFLWHIFTAFAGYYAIKFLVELDKHSSGVNY